MINGWNSYYDDMNVSTAHLLFLILSLCKMYRKYQNLSSQLTFFIIKYCQNNSLPYFVKTIDTDTPFSRKDHDALSITGETL